MRHQMYNARHRQGPFYVEYKDGDSSGFMSHEEANSLAEVFSGKVHYDYAELDRLNKAWAERDKSHRWQIAVMGLIVLIFAIMIFHK